MCRVDCLPDQHANLIRFLQEHGQTAGSKVFSASSNEVLTISSSSNFQFIVSPHRSMQNEPASTTCS